MSMPASYWPSSLKYFLFIANSPPAMVGDLRGSRGRGEELEVRPKLYLVAVKASVSHLMGPDAPSGPLSSEGGTGSHLKCSPQLKPPLTMGEGE